MKLGSISKINLTAFFTEINFSMVKQKSLIEIRLPNIIADIIFDGKNYKITQGILRDSMWQWAFGDELPGMMLSRIAIVADFQILKEFVKELMRNNINPIEFYINILKNTSLEDLYYILYVITGDNIVWKFGKLFSNIYESIYIHEIEGCKECREILDNIVTNDCEISEMRNFDYWDEYEYFDSKKVVKNIIESLRKLKKGCDKINCDADRYAREIKKIFENIADKLTREIEKEYTSAIISKIRRINADCVL